jgi:hypothetical protein
VHSGGGGAAVHNGRGGGAAAGSEQHISSSESSSSSKRKQQRAIAPATGRSSIVRGRGRGDGRGVGPLWERDRGRPLPPGEINVSCAMARGSRASGGCRCRAVQRTALESCWRVGLGV